MKSAGMNPESIMFSDRIQPQKVTFKKFHFYEMSRIGKCIETKRLMVSRAREQRKLKVTANGHRVSFGSDENVWNQILAMVI